MVLACVLAAVLVGTARISDWLADRVLEDQARASASAWARYVIERVPELDRILVGERPIAGLRDALEPARRAGTIRSFRLLDADGRERLALGAAEAMRSPDIRLMEEASTSGGPAVARAMSGAEIATRIAVPLGSLPGFVEIEIDQAQARASLERAFSVAGALLTVLILCGFGIPLLAFLRRHREKEEAERRIAYLARHDVMTGLANRLQLTERLNAGIAAGGRYSVLYIDLEGIQAINDLFGHTAGDGVIAEVAADLVEAAGSDCIVARLGGDEFCVARPQAPGLNEADLARRLLGAIGSVRRVLGQEVAIAASVGIASSSDTCEDAERLLKNAHLALTHAKVRGGGATVAFDARMDEELRQRRDLERRVREAAAADAFDLHFQPVYRVGEQRLVGFEALLRLPADSGGFVSPALFVPIAEELGLITQIGNWVIRRACAFAVEWPEELSVAVNLSPAQFKDGEVGRVVREALAATGLTPSRLELEITEGLLMSDSEAILRELGELKQLGVSIVMDDFGTGYSSLSYLWKFPFDKIKIDRSFMRGLDEKDSHVADILRAIMSLSRSLHLRVTAEGVETHTQAEFLRVLACDEVQGFLFGRPMPMTDVPAAIMRSFAPAAAEARMRAAG